MILYIYYIVPDTPGSLFPFLFLFTNWLLYFESFRVKKKPSHPWGRTPNHGQVKKSKTHWHCWLHVRYLLLSYQARLANRLVSLPGASRSASVAAPAPSALGSIPRTQSEAPTSRSRFPRRWNSPSSPASSSVFFSPHPASSRPIFPGSLFGRLEGEGDNRFRLLSLERVRSSGTTCQIPRTGVTTGLPVAISTMALAASM